MQETIVAIYDTAAHAEAAIRELKAGSVRPMTSVNTPQAAR